MGDFTRVDADRLRAVADRIWGMANEVCALRCPVLDPGALPGSQVAEVSAATAATVGAELEDVAAGLRGWALAARRAAEEFERADRDSGDRLGDRLGR